LADPNRADPAGRRAPLLERLALDRRRLLIGAAAGGGLALAWALWPRSYDQRPDTVAGETALSPFVKIDRNGQVIVLCPQAELGQGVFTLLAQILADELGADWRTIAVQPAPPGPLFANRLLVREWLSSDASRMAGKAGDWASGQWAQRQMLMLTGGSTSVAMFGQLFREAGATARVLLCQAAAARWDVAPETCDISAGIVSDGTRRAKIGDLAEEAAGFTPPARLPFRPEGREDALIGQDVQRLDVPSKIDGSANYAADIRLPDMIFAAIRQGPINAVGIRALNEAAARKVQGVLDIVREQSWVAVTARNWWAANQALNKLDPLFNIRGVPLHDKAIDTALDAAFDAGNGARFVDRGELAPVFDGARVVQSTYSVAPALHLALEPMAATARVRDDDVEVWMPTQAPVQARRAIARALDVRESTVTVYPLFAGGSFGRKMEVEAGVQAALIARAAKAPVQLLWSRAEDIMRDVPRPPARAKMTARLGEGGLVRGLLAEVAAPPALAQTWARVGRGLDRAEALADTAGTADRLAVESMDLPYSIPNLAVDHFPADLTLPTGRWRGNGASYGTFFAESFINELAQYAQVEPMSFRMQMLGGHPRLAHCLTTAATMGGWQGAVQGSGQGLACAMFKGAYIAAMVEAGMEGTKVRISRIIAVVDCGAAINPAIARQQIEGGLIFGLAMALGASPSYAGGLPIGMRLRDYGLPAMADVGEVTVELVQNEEAVRSVNEIGVLPVAPALAAALTTITGRHYRQLPLMSPSA
jgi:isoquinoline 1-oxidoreductase beta subunit